MSENSKKPAADQRVIKVEISKDEKTAWLITTKGATYSVEELEGALRGSGVVKGINRDRLVKSAAGKKLLTSEPIAKFSPPQVGKAAQIKYLIQHEVKPAEREDGTLDFREINLLKNISKGDLLVKKIPPTIGESGCTVTGKEIEGKKGKDLNIRNYSGQGTIILEEEPDEIVAAIDGIYKLQKSGKVIVLDLFTIKSDIDYSTGNVRSTSSVVIHGDIKSGFEVECKGDLSVKGLVEDATVKVEGDMVVNYGLTQGESPIEVKGELRAMYMYNRAKVEAGSVSVNEMISHSCLTADGEVRAGRIVGGEVVAKENIVVKEAGSSAHESKTSLTAGFDRENLNLRAELRSQFEEKEIMLEELDSEHEKLKKWAIDFKRNSAKMLKEISQIENPSISEKIKQSLKAKFARLQECGDEIKQMRTSIDELTDKIDELNEELANNMAKVVVSGIVFPGVKITIGESEPLILQNRENRVTFLLDSNGDIMLSRV